MDRPFTQGNYTEDVWSPSQNAEQISLGNFEVHRLFIWGLAKYQYNCMRLAHEAGLAGRRATASTQHVGWLLSLAIGR